MDYKILILKIIQMKMEIEIMNYYTIGRIENGLEPKYNLTDNDKKNILHSARKMLKDYEEEEKVYLITNDKLSISSYRDYINYRILKYYY